MVPTLASLLPKDREGNKIATTNVTNELARCIRESSFLDTHGPGQPGTQLTRIVIVKVGQANPVGFYDGYSLMPLPQSAPRTNVQEGDLGTFVEISDITLINPSEISATNAAIGSQLVSNSYLGAIIVGTDENGKNIAIPLSPTVSGNFPVRVKFIAGSDGTSTSLATWTYSLYLFTNTGLTGTPLNATPLQPDSSPARVQYGSVVVPSNGSVGQAYIAKDGTIALWSVQEVRADPVVCS